MSAALLGLNEFVVGFTQGRRTGGLRSARGRIGIVIFALWLRAPRTREPPILPHGDENDRCGCPDENPLQDWTPSSCRCQPRLEAHLAVQVCGLEKVGPDQLTPVWCYHRTDPSGTGNHHVSVVLDGPYLGECQLLFAHCLVEGGVVAGHGQQLRAAQNRLPRGAVEDHLPAGSHPDRDPSDAHHTGAVAGHEVAGAVGVAGEVPKQPRHGQVLAEGLHDCLVVAVGRPGAGIPDNGRIGPLRIFTRTARNIHQGADQDRRADRFGRCGDPLTGVGVDERVDVRRVLRPDDELGLLRQPRMHVGGQPQRLLNVVV
ncbi:Uncharacterised protein [Mycobacterium tuberculosis]|nr:Uncharacterised protein [Mycobacterium tuberculosis]CKS20032.1 Uncharacterised protein [Mycobacterium tuberculosis]CKS89223.1 Uncharacterised protein [Mycobacterium tuberculosis]CKT74873.1 Uncharacterised protein [Mycobacterium tuberculosis]CNU13131.1 Uncharacterised protein [Mycobacterium tuberculosis]